jgi:hypothetical protein
LVEIDGDEARQRDVVDGFEFDPLEDPSSGGRFVDLVVLDDHRRVDESLVDAPDANEQLHRRAPPPLDIVLQAGPHDEFAPARQ